MYLFVMGCITVSKSTCIGVGGLIIKKTVIFTGALANEKYAWRVREVTRRLFNNCCSNGWEPLILLLLSVLKIIIKVLIPTVSYINIETN